MRLHPRHEVTQRANIELEMFIIEWMEKHDLTYGEIISAIGQSLTRTAKYMIRQERHGDTGKAGDEE